MSRLLDQIDSPADLRQMKQEDLPALAREIREEIIRTVSQTGGHLAPSLGTVELAVAIHYVFDTPHDRLVWDVGHQAYAHKLLTGRRDRFGTLRQKNGLSGFPKRAESEYDTFDVGHASTSISAALGMSVGLELKQDDAHTIAVIGDGSMTGGLAFEGLNQAGELNKKIIVILNDNEMSISPNVGALSSFLSRKMTTKTHLAFRQEIKDFLRTVPSVGEGVIRLIQRSEGSFRGFISPSYLFEALQFDYIGPIRGHRFDRLIEALSNSRNLDTPVLVHVLTTKGKGYEPAERNPTHFHGVGRFEVETGASAGKTSAAPTYTNVFGNYLLEQAEQDERVVAITAAMPEGTGLDTFREKMPHRFFDVGIAEGHAVTFAAGLAVEGLRPVVAIYSTFLQRAFDQVVHDVCLQNLPVFFCLDRGGLVGEDGPTHHGFIDLSYLRCVPNMVVMAPKDEDELRGMMALGLTHNGPVAVRYPRGKGLGVPLADHVEPVPLGKGELLRQGDDVVLLALGQMVGPSLDAAALLAERGVQAGVVNMRFVKPLDRELVLDVAGRTGRIITLEDNNVIGGLGSAVAELLAEEGLGVRLRRLGIPDTYVEHGTQAELRAALGLDKDGIVAAVEEFVRA